MPISSAVITDLGPTRSAGDLFSATRTITFDSAYPTGGEAASAADFGLNRILRAETPHVITRTGAAAPVTAVLPLVQAAGGLLLLAQWTIDGESDIVQVTNGTDLSGLAIIQTVHGY